MAAVIGSRLSNHVQASFKIAKTVYWSDSQIVLSWISSSNNKGQFIRSRAEEIRSRTESNHCRYCPTDNNPADLLTRGIETDRFISNKLWWKGPTWLSDETKWPHWTPQRKHTVLLELAEDVTDGTDESTRSIVNGVVQVIDISRYSTLQRLLRVTAYVCRFKNNCKSCKQDRISGSLTPHELHKAEDICVKACQESGYADVLTDLHMNSQMRSIVKQLRLYIYNHGILRCGGRLHNAPIPDSAKFTVLLPTKHLFTDLVILNAHHKQLYSGTNSTMMFIRQRYWIPAIRQCVNKLLRRCVICRKTIGKSYSSPVSPPLPKARVEDAPPFTVTGVDFTGALTVKQRNGFDTKAYICLFTCASTREIHLEVVTNLSSDSFILAFRRFSSRITHPSLTISDNAMTFVAAAEIIKTIRASGFDWQFIPERAPWFGGFWERMIGVTKTCLKKIMGKSHLSLETLQTLIAEIEAVINDRPITFVSANIDDDEPFTPANLIHGRRITSPDSEIDISDSDYGTQDHLSRRYIQLQKMLAHFKKRWKAEYLLSLREFHKLSGGTEQKIRNGDVVLVHDDVPRTRWKLAIEERMPGNGGLVRAARIKTVNGVTNRPIIKLIPLDVNHQEDNEGPVNSNEHATPTERPQRQSAKAARDNINKWAHILRNGDK